MTKSILIRTLNHHSCKIELTSYALRELNPGEHLSRKLDFDSGSSSANIFPGYIRSFECGLSRRGRARGGVLPTGRRGVSRIRGDGNVGMGKAESARGEGRVQFCYALN